MYIIISVPCTSGQVRLISGGNSNYQYGRVEMCSNGTWTKVCGSHWYNNEASVTCSSLGFSPYGKEVILKILLY